jgi:hypothetical protein
VSAGSQFDQLVIDGNATLAGTLDVALRNAFTPSSGDTFRIVSFASRSGEFTQMASPSAVLRANYTGSDLTLLSEVPGIKVNPTFGLKTSEAGAAASFTVVLDTAPMADVSVGLLSDNAAEGTLSTSSLVFTPQNWNLPQSVTVTGVDDPIDDGDVTYHVVTAPAVSADPAYNGFNASDVALSNLNDDHAGFIFSATSGWRPSESGTSATFTVALASKPAANVSFALASNKGNEGTVLPSHLTFTPQNWNIAQTVTASGVDDQVVDGDVAWAIVTSPAVSSDLKYQGLNPPDVSLVNRDNDTLDPAHCQPGPVAGLWTPVGRHGGAQLDGGERRQRCHQPVLFRPAGGQERHQRPDAAQHFGALRPERARQRRHRSRWVEAAAVFAATARRPGRCRGAQLYRHAERLRRDQ